MAEQAEFQAGRALRADVFTITPGDAPMEIGSGGIYGFITQTKFEAGKYITPETFVSLQEQARNLGVAIERRTQDGWRITAMVEPQVGAARAATELAADSPPDISRAVRATDVAVLDRGDRWTRNWTGGPAALLPQFLP